MPIPLTKYSKLSALHIDLSNNSYQYNQYILTCDVSDTVFLDNGIQRSSRIYLNSKANYLMHGFSNIINCETKFNTVKDLYKYKKANTPAISGNSDYNTSVTQKIIQNTVRVPSSLYSNNLASLYINSDDIQRPWHNGSDRKEAHGIKSNLTPSSIKPNLGVDIKHNSYDRYLGRKKSQHLKSDKETSTVDPMWGNKSYKFSIVNCKKTC